jgi:hypothetical protein
MFEKGDNFVHFTKYGGVNKGEVASVGYISLIDTTNNVRLNLDGTDGKIYKIERELSPEDSKSMVNLAAKLGQRKAQVQFDLQEKINSGQLKLPNNE